MSGTLVKEGVVAHFSDQTLQKICDAQVGVNRSLAPGDYSLFQVSTVTRKRKFEADERMRELDMHYEERKHRITAYHTRKMAQLKEEMEKEKQRLQRHVIQALSKRKKEISKLITKNYEVIDCQNREGNWVVKLRRRIQCTMTEDEANQILSEKFEIPPLPPERKHHVRSRPSSRVRKRNGFVKVNGSRSNVQSFQWGLTASEIRQDLKRLNLYDSSTEIQETSGFLNEATIKKRSNGGGKRRIMNGRFPGRQINVRQDVYRI